MSLQIKLTADLTNPHTHYIKVTCDIQGVEGEELILAFPIWSPGSYLVREYQSQIENLAIGNKSGKKIFHEKISKNRWKIFCKGQKSIRVTYRVYTQELNVRSCYLDSHLGFFNPTSVFFYPEGFLNSTITLKVILPPKWISAQNTSFSYTARQGFDDFYDVPFLAAPKLELRKFKSGKTNYTLAFWGNHFADTKKIAMDTKAIVEKQIKIFGGHPCKNYLFQILFVNGKYGGLEHANSSTNLFDGSILHEPKHYREFLSLLSHEHFHLWNVKRIRPRELGPFDYSQEVYTKDLWVSEGFTSYYDDLCVYQAGKMKREEYLEVLSENLKRYENQKAKLLNSVADSSFDTWIRFYRPNENSPNTVVSYYLKGSLIALILDLRLISLSKGKKRLGDVMKLLYKDYLSRPHQGFTRKEFWVAVKKVSPTFNTRDFEKKYIEGTHPINWNQFIKNFGLKFQENKKKNPNYLGITLGKKEGKMMVRLVAEDSPAYHSLIRAGDELLAINDQRIDEEKQLDPFLKQKNLKLLFARFGKVNECAVQLSINNNFDKKLIVAKKIKKSQKKLQGVWLKR